jgi:hypothetical protein
MISSSSSSTNGVSRPSEIDFKALDLALLLKELVPTEFGINLRVLQLYLSKACLLYSASFIVSCKRNFVFSIGLTSSEFVAFDFLISF